MEETDVQLVGKTGKKILEETRYFERTGRRRVQEIERNL